MKQDVLLEVRDLSVSFPGPGGAIPALSGLSYSVRSGEAVGIVGESGAGKSVSAAALLRLVPPPGEITGGSILFDGADVLKLDRDALRCFRGGQAAMIFQNPMTSLNPVLTVGAQLTEALAAHGGADSPSAARRRAGALLERAGLTDPDRYLGQYPHRLSGGERQRVCIAMALMCSPRLLIADEPTTALDVTTQARILALLDSLRRDAGMSLLLVTHNLGAAARICDSVCVLYGGRLMERGPVEDIFYRPAHPYTLGLLRSVPRADGSGHPASIPGAPAAPDGAYPGCPFAPRCIRCMRVCLSRVPPLSRVAGDHDCACWLQALERLRDCNPVFGPAPKEEVFHA